MRWRLRKNSVATWDNRCTQHYAVQDFWPAVRNLERAGIIGDRPGDLNGAASRRPPTPALPCFRSRAHATHTPCACVVHNACI